MKHLLLLLLTILVCLQLSFGLSAQDIAYKSTAVEGANWIIKDSETTHNPYISFVRRIEGDTTVEGRNYKKLYQQVIDHIMNEHTDPPLARPYSVFPERELIGLLRDDIGGRKVYGMVRNSVAFDFSSDTLLHDYSLEVGDTLRGLWFDPEIGTPVILEVVEEYYFGDLRRTQITTGGDYFEGVGSGNYGPTSGGTSFLTACCINYIIEYCVGDLSDCNVWLTPVTELSADYAIKTYPNPFTSQLNFAPSENQSAAPVYVTLRDVTGRLRKKGKLGDGLQWSTDALALGMYIATFTSGTRRATVKLVKQ